MSVAETSVAPAGVWRSSLRLWRTRIGIALVLLLVGVAACF